VVDGMNEWIKNAGYTGQVSRFGDRGMGLASIKKGRHPLQVQFEFKALSNDSTLVRIRTYDSFALIPEEEFFSSFTYQYLFNQIGQELFTEALNIDAAELN
jgi:hypothetical protein